MSEEVGVTLDQIDIVRWISSSDLGRRAATLFQRQNYGEGGKTVMKGVNLLGVGLLSVTFPDLPGGHTRTEAPKTLTYASVISRERVVSFSQWQP